MRKTRIQALSGKVAFAVLLILVLAACGSKPAANSGSNGGTSPSPSAPNGASASQSAQKLDLTPFIQGRDIALKSTPMEFQGPTEKAVAPKNVKMAIVTCNSALSGCVAPSKGAESAAKELGWTTQVYDGGGTPDQQNKMMLNAISWGADVIVNIAIDPNLVQQGLTAAQEAGVPVVSGSNGIDSPNPVSAADDGKLKYAFDVAPDYAGLGSRVADWIIADSNGEANIVIFSDKEFPSVLALEAGLMDELNQCTTCTIQQRQYFTGNQVGTTLGTQTVGFLRSNPDVQYVFSPFDPAAAAQVAAIKQAGLDKNVKLIGVLGVQQNIDYIRKEQVQAADAAYDNEYMGWAIVDQTIRLMNKQALFEPHGENLPYGVIDKTNLPDPGIDWKAPFDYKSKFLELWR